METQLAAALNTGAAPAAMPPATVGPTGSTPPDHASHRCWWCACARCQWRSLAQRSACAGAAAVDPVAEQRAYDPRLSSSALAALARRSRRSSAFIRNFPRSTLVPSAQYWIGNSLTPRATTAAPSRRNASCSQHPDSAKASDALLNIATAQSDLGELQAARASLQEVISKYPSSEAATKARQRLGLR